jgi:hypothetical protein
MQKKTLTLLALPLALSACTTLYTKERDWKLPGGLGRYTLSARMDVGFLTRTITISVNNRELLSGSGYLWSDQIDMTGNLDGFPLAASCHKDAKTCDVSIAGFQAATLNF